MLDKRLGDITVEDIQALVENNVLEGKTLEYKSELPGNASDDKKEFLADVSSLANTLGGELIYGVRENNGAVDSEIGLISIDADAEIARLENIIRDGVSPRIPVEMHPIQWENKTVLVLRMRASLQAPHRVVFGGHDKFYRRNSNGKYPMDVGELKIAFLQSGEIVERIRRFREVRISDIQAGEAPLPVMSTDRFIGIHIIPLSAFNATQRLSPRVIEDVSSGRESLFTPFPSVSNYSHQINLEGVVVYTPNQEQRSWHYTQMYHDGKIEVYDSVKLTRAAGSQSKTIAMHDLESSTLAYVNKMRKMLDKLGFNPPYYVFVSLIGVRGLSVHMPQGAFESTVPIRQNDLLLPEVLLEKSDDDLVQKLKPVFDMVWNAAGISESPNFTEQAPSVEQVAG
jgi:hypothetical protein